MLTNMKEINSEIHLGDMHSENMKTTYAVLNSQTWFKNSSLFNLKVLSTVPLS